MMHRVLPSLFVLCVACSEKTAPTTSQATASATPARSVPAAPIPSIAPSVPASAPAAGSAAPLECGRPPAPGVACVHPKSPLKACEENWLRALPGCGPDAKTLERCDDGFVGYCKYPSGLVTYFYGNKKLAEDGTLPNGCKSAGGLFCKE